MTIREQIDTRFKQARRERDDPTKTVIGMLKNKVLMELKSGSERQEDDALWMEVITSYAKQLRKSIAEFEKLGERGAEAKADAEFELGFCDSFLPKKLDEAATETLIRQIVAEQNISSPKQMGKLMGVLMKSHRDEIDGELARTVAQKVLQSQDS